MKIFAQRSVDDVFGDNFTNVIFITPRTIQDPFDLANFAQSFNGLEVGVISSYTNAMAYVATIIDSLRFDLYMSRATVCFAAGTQVIVGRDASGSYPTRRIEELQSGDLVLSRSEHDPAGEIHSRRVVKLFRRMSDHLRVLQVQAKDGVIATIRTTDSHEFWVDGPGWVRAGDIEVGVQVRDPDGSHATIVSSGCEPHPETIAVYNIEVAEDHTFFVAAGIGEQIGVWVHNTRACSEEEADEALAEEAATEDMRDYDLEYLEEHDMEFVDAPSKNSLESLAPAEGYVLVDKTSGEPLKYGMTTQGKGRYTETYLNRINAKMEMVTEGSVRDMRSWENKQILDYYHATRELPPYNFNFH